MICGWEQLPKDYFEGVLPFNWRGWWDYGTGALGDMACHIMAPAFAVAELGYPLPLNAVWPQNISRIGREVTGPTAARSHPHHAYL